MTERERKLRDGFVEGYNRDTVHFYWEPYYNEKTKEVEHAFTIDHGVNRIRLPNFDGAVRILDEYIRNLDIDEALKALGIQGGRLQ